jgi:hypothetical protein
VVAEDGAVVPPLWSQQPDGRRSPAPDQYGVPRRGACRSRLLDITTDPHTDAYGWTTTMHFADRFQLTLYDAAYLELAHRRSLPLASLDADLRDAGRALGFPLLGAAA